MPLKSKYQTYPRRKLTISIASKDPTNAIRKAAVNMTYEHEGNMLIYFAWREGKSIIFDLIKHILNQTIRTISLDVLLPKKGTVIATTKVEITKAVLMSIETP